MRHNWIVRTLPAVAALLALLAGCNRATAPQPAAAVKTATAPSDLSGVWRRERRAPDNARQYTIFELSMTITNDAPPLTPWGLAKFKTARPNIGPGAVSIAKTNDPVMNCLPPGVPRIYLQRGSPMEILQVPGRVLMLFEYDHFVRQIFTDGRPHMPDAPPTWMGDAIGKWEGDTLVVDTVNFNDKTWLDMSGHPHSDQLHLIERMRRIDPNTLTIDATIDDPKAYTKPWGGHALFELKPTWNIGEVICEDNASFLNIQKKAEAAK